MMLKTTSQRSALNGGKQLFMKNLVRDSSAVTLIQPQAGKSGLAFLTTLPLTLLCRISSYSKKGSLLLIYHVEPPYNKKQQSQEKKRRGGCSGRSVHVLLWVLLIWNLTHWFSFLTLDLPGHNRPAWWTLGCVCPWLTPPDLLLRTDLRIDFCAWPQACFITRNLPDDLGSGLTPTALPCLPCSLARGGGTGLGWEGPALVAAESASAPGFPPSKSSWPSWHQQRTPLMGVSGIVKWSQRRSLAHIYHR